MIIDASFGLVIVFGVQIECTCLHLIFIGYVAHTVNALTGLILYITAHSCLALRLHRL